jgi:hypothetical protein
MTAFRRGYVHAVVGAVLALAGSALRAQPPDRVRVIIGFQQQPGPNEQALVRALGATILHSYWLVPAIAAEVPQSALQALRNNPNVTNVDIDTQVYEIDAELDASVGVKRIGSGVVHDGGNRGAGVRVCVIDSGVDYTHPDLSGSFEDGWDFVNDDSDPFDDRGHGTHVTGIVLARDNGFGVVGVAPEAQVLAYKILDQNGQGFIADAIAALQECILAGGRVTNSSFGTQSDPGSTVKAAYDNAEALGLVNVAAAGNRTSLFGTCTTIAFPARYSSVIAVTSTDSNDKIASTSCRGPEAELAAPGVNINSTVPTGSCAYCASSGYRTLSGTSMASPHVAGVAALVVASDIGDADEDGWINDEVRQRLQLTADDLGTAGRDSSYGYGLVDADEAAPPAPPNPPAAPSNLTATAMSSSRIDLSWEDNSNNESGFKVERCTDSPCSDAFVQIASVGAGVTSYSNTGLQASTTHTYRVRAFNAGGDSDYSSTAFATTQAAASITLSAVGYKVQGVQRADLSWNGAASTDVDIFRNNVKITTTANDGFHTDNIGSRGGGSYTYRICEAGTSNCSNDDTVIF